jgi:hypothetical protein
MKISSQLANNFDYCSAEFGVSLIKNSSLCVLRASAVKIFLFLKTGHGSTRRVRAGGGLISLTNGIGSSSIFTGSILTAGLPVRPSIQ